MCVIAVVEIEQLLRNCFLCKILIFGIMSGLVLRWTWKICFLFTWCGYWDL